MRQGGNPGSFDLRFYKRQHEKGRNSENSIQQGVYVAFALELYKRGAVLLILGDDESDQFPEQLKFFRTRRGDGIKVNFLVNYGWDWDLEGLRYGRIRSHNVSRLDLIVRWAAEEG